MRRYLLIPFVLTLSLAAAPLSAFAQETGTAVQPGFWGAEVPGGSFYIAIKEIIAVAQHTYVVDGSARVTEVNIASSANALVRYYHIEPITPETPSAVGKSVLNKVQELANEAAGRVGLDDLKVIKNYPTTTHAGTVEFRLDSHDNLTKIFESAREALLRQRAAIVKIK